MAVFAYQHNEGAPIERVTASLANFEAGHVVFYGERGSGPDGIASRRFIVAINNDDIAKLWIEETDPA